MTDKEARDELKKNFEGKHLAAALNLYKWCREENGKSVEDALAEVKAAYTIQL